MKYQVENIHSKPVAMPGGVLLPGKTRIIDLPEQVVKYCKTTGHVKLKKVTVKKKKVTKDGIY